MKIAVSTGNSRMDKKWNLTEMELEDFRERISKTQRTAETMEQYRKMKKSQQDDIKDVGGFVLGRLKGGRRKKEIMERAKISYQKVHLLIAGRWSKGVRKSFRTRSFNKNKQGGYRR